MPTSHVSKEKKMTGPSSSFVERAACFSVRPLIFLLIELGFGFGDSSSPKLDQRLSYTLLALGFYYAINKHYKDTVSKSTIAMPPSSAAFKCYNAPSPLGRLHTIFSQINIYSIYILFLFFFFFFFVVSFLFLFL